MELVGLVAKASGDSLLALYDELGGDLRGFALALTRDPEAADDLVQESFLRLLRESSGGRWPNDPRAWPFTVCANLVRSRRRHQAAGERRRGLLSDDPIESAETALLRRERRAAVREAMSELPHEAQVAVMLSAEGFSGREIARCLHRSEGATRTLLWRARRALHDRLVEQASP